MNYYLNTLNKVKSLLKIDDTLTKEQSEVFQWQLLVDCPACEDYKFVIGKGGVNTIFVVTDSLQQVTSRRVMYPDQALELLTKLSRRKAYCYLAADKSKKEHGYFLHLKSAMKPREATRIISVDFSGKRRIEQVKKKDLYGNYAWTDQI